MDSVGQRSHSVQSDNDLHYPQKLLVLSTVRKVNRSEKPSGNIVRKEKYLFPQCFVLFYVKSCCLELHFNVVFRRFQFGQIIPLLHNPDFNNAVEKRLLTLF